MDFQVPYHGNDFHSHKFRGSVLHYELVLNIQTGDICWIKGPFLPGKMNDLEIFYSSLMTLLYPIEQVEADDGCGGKTQMKVKCLALIAVPEERRLS